MEQSSSIFVIKGVRQDSIGNPVQIGSGPAAVTSMFPPYTGNKALGPDATVRLLSNGKAARSRMKPEDLPLMNR